LDSNILKKNKNIAKKNTYKPKERVNMKELRYPKKIVSMFMKLKSLPVKDTKHKFFGSYIV
jgi:hypothetical protein